MEKNDWTRHLHERLDNHKTAVPDGVWDDIERRLDAMRRPRRPRRALLVASWLTAAAAVALLLVGVFHTDDAALDPIAIQRAAAGQGNAATVKVQSAAASLSASPLAVAAVPGRSVRRVAEYGDATVEMPVADMASPHDEAAPTVAETAETAAVQSNEAPAYKERKVSAVVPPAQSREQWDVHRSARRASQWSVDAYAGNAVAQSQGMTGSLSVLSSRAPSAESNGGVCVDNPPLLLADYKEVKHHNPPLSFGVSLAYGLTDRLALRSGLVYTRVTSDFIHVLGTDELTDRQTLHYIGVPLALNCKVWGSRSVHTYATVGAQIDFNVKATLDTSAGEGTMHKDRPQFSGNAAVGIEYDIVPQVGLYAEPGVRYYFDNRSTVENVFKTRPWAFNVQMGVRINVK